MKIYISGKITGLELADAQLNFQRAEDLIKSLGHEPVNPMKVCPFHPDHTWKHYMIEDIKALLECDAIYMLDNWEQSKGANTELQLAISLGLEQHYAETFEPKHLQPC